MGIEEKLEEISKKVDAKKRDLWDKIQIVATILTGVIALCLTAINLYTTSHISDLSTQQNDTFHKDQLAELKNVADRKDRDDRLAEFLLLPKCAEMIGSPDHNVRDMAMKILESIKEDSLFKKHIIATYFDGMQRATETPHYAQAYNTPVNGTGHPFWVYLGQTENNKWITNCFGLKELPPPNTVIVANMNVYKHDSKPVQIGDPNADTWDFGNRIGAIQKGSKVKVLETTTLTGDNYWAKVQ
jgi:hypothetical protein